jgi:hypothetical protein
MNRLGILLVAIVVTTGASAQTATIPSSTLEWDYPQGEARHSGFACSYSGGRIGQVGPRARALSLRELPSGNHTITCVAEGRGSGSSSAPVTLEIAHNASPTAPPAPVLCRTIAGSECALSWTYSAPATRFQILRDGDSVGFAGPLARQMACPALTSGSRTIGIRVLHQGILSPLETVTWTHPGSEGTICSDD